MRILVSGSNGLIGGQVVQYFGTLGHDVVGFDNNQRREFFGEAGDTLWNQSRINHLVWQATGKDAKFHGTDIRDRSALDEVFRNSGPFDAVIHCAAQPSHDKSREIPLTDFDVNAVGTINLLETTRKHCPEAVFIHMSTNKVYGDAPNEKLLVELPTRFDFAKSEDKAGIDETCRLDQSTHSIFGASKVAADIMVQEYGRIYGLKTTVLRGGCLTGPGHSGVELHGFLSYLIKTAVSGGTYKIYGYKGKQVRDNIHSLDVVRAMEEIIKKPGIGAVYNIGGGRENSVSILEAIKKIEDQTGKKVKTEYVDVPRTGDHICYITDLAKFKKNYPDWKITKSIDDTIADILAQYYWGNYSDHEDTFNYDLTDASLVMDVGGFRGSWTASILHHGNPRVMLFEPVEEFRDACKVRFANHPRVEIFPYGLSDKTGMETFSKSGVHTTQFQSLSEIPSDPISTPSAETVSLVDAAEVLEKVDEVDLMSLNCEGGEFKIIPRLLETGLIRKVKNLQIQFHRCYPDADRVRDEIRKELSKGFKEKFNYPFVWESWQRLS